MKTLEATEVEKGELWRFMSFLIRTYIERNEWFRPVLFS